VSYRVKHTEGVHADDHDGKQPLVFRVKYRDIARDLVAQLAERLMHDLVKSPYMMYAGMLLHSFQETMHVATKTISFKQAEMSGNVQLPPYRSVGLEDIVHSLYGQQAVELAGWLRNWYNVSPQHESRTFHGLTINMDRHKPHCRC